MRNNFDIFFKTLMSFEGGFVNSPEDPGGATNMGITQKAWEAFKGKESCIEEIKAITQNEAFAFYRKQYWVKILGDFLDSGVDVCVFDAAVHSGVSKASKWLQICTGQVEDGVIGIKTYKASKEMDAVDLISRYCALRTEKMVDFPAFKTYKKGWLKRVARVEEEALAMAKQ